MEEATMKNGFDQLGIRPKIIKAIEEMNFYTPTKVQAETIPKILDKKDLIVMSKTGSGKTGAFGLPMLQMIESNEQGPYGLVLTPTRELAVQVNYDFTEMAKYSDIRTTAIYGQHNMETEINVLKKGVGIVTGTPGRVADHIKRRTLKTRNIAFLVLDEADRMLDMGFLDQVVKIIKALPRERITLLFSATMPLGIQRICRGYMNNPITIELETETKTVDTVNQIYYRVEQNEKRMQLDRILKAEQPDSCMVFCNTRVEVDRVQEFLYRKGYVSDALHGANTQSSRMRTINKFKQNELQILVATDVAARGIHVEDLSLVINYDVPFEKDSYVHRIGRTGRAGNSGKAITLVTGEDIISLYEIEEHVGVRIDEVPLPTNQELTDKLEKAAGKWVGVQPKKQVSKRQSTHEGRHKGRASSTYKTSSHHKNKEVGKKQYVEHKKMTTAKPYKKQQGLEKTKTNSAYRAVEKKVTKHRQEPLHKKQHHATKHKGFPKVKKERIKVKTKIVETKMGPIEMRVTEKESTSFFKKLSRLFSK